MHLTNYRGKTFSKSKGTERTTSQNQHQTPKTTNACCLGREERSIAVCTPWMVDFARCLVRMLLYAGCALKQYARSRFGVVVDRCVLVNGQRGRVQCNGVPARLVLLGRGLTRLCNGRTRRCTIRYKYDWCRLCFIHSLMSVSTLLQVQVRYVRFLFATIKNAVESPKNHAFPVIRERISLL